MEGVIRHFKKQIFPLLKECRSWITYHKVVLGGNGVILRRMKKTESIFIHIPKTAGKSILKGLYGIDMHDGFGHAGAGFYLSVFGWSKFNKYYKFAFVRNPWDRAFSGYKFARKGGFRFPEDIKLKNELRHLSFESFVKNWLPKQDLDDLIIFCPQYKFICDSDGALLVDRVCYFEDMINESRKVLKRFHISSELPHINKSLSHGSYKDYYDREMIEVIGKLYYRDIEIFRYSFDGLSDL